MKKIVEPLLKWYQENKRDLPWREDQNPYHIWISEIMLQQTRVETVKEYYRIFMEKIPDIETLSKIQEDELLKLWEGLGYYSRARNLQVAAKEIMELKKFPDTYQELLKLRGIGPYTAGAIASIAFQERVPAIDGNVIRVMLRLKNSRRNPADEKLKKELFEELKEIMPSSPGDFNQALMDLGATVCIPNTDPLCHCCPIQKYCKAYQEHNTLNIPVPKEKQTKKEEKYTIIIFSQNGKIAIRKRPNKGLLAGLYEFYTIPKIQSLPKLKKALEEQNIEIIKVQRLGASKHIFTHKIWNMQGYLIKVKEQFSGFLWVSKEELNGIYSIPTAFKTYQNKI